MKIKNLVFYDFETTGRNPNIAGPLSLAFIVSNPNNPKLFYQKSFLIKFPKSFLTLSVEEKAGLDFNGIKNQKDLDHHNKNAIPLQEALNIFVNSVQKIFNFQKFILIGYNNINYDNKILSRLLSIYRPQDFYYMLQNTYDIYKFINNARHYSEISSNEWNKTFGSENRKLETVYNYIFKKGFKAHEALEDVKATLMLYRYFSLKFPKRLEQEIEEHVITINVPKELFEFKEAGELVK